ncbi:hypothetical protein [Rubellimicrobium arenae]|uniref:hypothetical protein n=1 Tax=Rubellimicrobium arenae TaxID=2817372 RepID=UPI001B313412|nr:hypothetical protein [Rubellimicrobium arenae]
MNSPSAPTDPRLRRAVIWHSFNRAAEARVILKTWVVAPPWTSEPGASGAPAVPADRKPR